MSINTHELARRRRDLMLKMSSSGVAIIPAASLTTRSRDTEYVFRQDSDFFYLTGFAEPEAMMVLAPEREEGEYIVFCQPKDAEKELWEGRREGPDGLVQNYGVDEAHAIDELEHMLPKLLQGRDRIYYPVGQNTGFDQRVTGWLNSAKAKVRSGITPPRELSDVTYLLHEMRLLKSESELTILAAAGELGARAHIRAMNKCKPGMYEYQLEAEILHEFASNGARSPAYTSIVGGGQNACILHYNANDQQLDDGDLVLIDAGCELAGYATDITRTFPVNGKFSEPQRELYALVLKAQEAALEKVKAGLRWNEPHDEAVRVITQGLVDLGLLAGEVDVLIEDEKYKDFYMHRIGHWLGMDVHDVGAYKIGGDWRVMEPGMVMTVEPGIYVNPENQNVAAKWRGIGIRIEDVVAVTEEGCRILTGDVPKAPDDIEALMAM